MGSPRSQRAIASRQRRRQSAALADVASACSGECLVDACGWSWAEYETLAFVADAIVRDCGVER